MHCGICLRKIIKHGFNNAVWQLCFIHLTQIPIIYKMCESTNPEENVSNQNDNFCLDNGSDEEYNNEDDASEIDDELTSEELLELDGKLDALNLALDAMESKRETIHVQLLDLLKSSQDVRKEIQEQKMNVEVTDNQSETT